MSLWGPDCVFESRNGEVAQMGHKNSTTAVRNRAILAAHEAGQTVEDLAELYRLTLLTVRSVLRQEKHKRVVSRDEFYLALRRESS